MSFQPLAMEECAPHVSHTTLLLSSVEVSFFKNLNCFWRSSLQLHSCFLDIFIAKNDHTQTVDSSKDTDMHKAHPHTPPKRTKASPGNIL